MFILQDYKSVQMEQVTIVSIIFQEVFENGGANVTDIIHSVDKSYE